MEMHIHWCSFTAAGVNDVAGSEAWAGVPLALMQPVSCTAEHVNLGINARLVKTAERFAVSQPTVGQSVCQRPLLSAASKEQDVRVCRCRMPALLARQAAGSIPAFPAAYSFSVINGSEFCARCESRRASVAVLRREPPASGSVS